jgi:hypothetical protein
MTGWVLLETGWLLGTMGLPAGTVGAWRMWLRSFGEDPVAVRFHEVEQGPPAPRWPLTLPLEPELAYLQQLPKSPMDKGTPYRPRHAKEPLDSTGEWPVIRMEGGVWLPKVQRRIARTVTSSSISQRRQLRGQRAQRTHRST